MNTTTTVAVIAAIGVVGALGYHLGQRSTQECGCRIVVEVVHGRTMAASACRNKRTYLRSRHGQSTQQNLYAHG